MRAVEAAEKENRGLQGSQICQADRMTASSSAEQVQSNGGFSIKHLAARKDSRWTDGPGKIWLRIQIFG